MYVITELNTHTKQYFSTANDIYDYIVRKTGDHTIASEMESFARLSPYGDNWTNEEIGIDLYIEEEDEE